MASIFEKNIRTRIRGNRHIDPLRRAFSILVRLVVVGVLLLSVWYGTRFAFLTIDTVSIEGGETISHEEIRALVYRELEGAYFLIIPRRFTFLYPHDRIEEVLEQLPRIHDVTISRLSLKSLVISFKEYMPQSVWCSYNRSDIPCFLVDSEGYAFEESPAISGGTLIRHNVEGIESISAGMVIEKSKLESINTFLKDIEEQIGFRITSLIHRRDGDIEFLVNGGGSILVAGSTDMSEAFLNLKTLVASEEFKHIAPGNFKYIDVRFKNKAFVNEELEEVIFQETASTT